MEFIFRILRCNSSNRFPFFFSQSISLKISFTNYFEIIKRKIFPRAVEEALYGTKFQLISSRKVQVRIIDPRQRRYLSSMKLRSGITNSYFTLVFRVHLSVSMRGQCKIGYI